MDEKLKRAQSLVGTSEGRPDNDFYPTPPEATRALFEMERFEGDIWEPACGRGDMAEVFKEYGHDVICTDIHDYGYSGLDDIVDFMKFDDPHAVVNNVITNPPFKHAVEFVRQGLRYSDKKVALLLKLAFLEGGARYDMFKTTPLARVHVFSKRLKLTREGAEYKNGGMIAFAWFVWEHGYTGEPTIDWIKNYSACK